MEAITARIELFHNLYLICMGGSIVCLIISVILFRRFQIMGIIEFFTGKQAKREITKLQDAEFEKKSEKRLVTPGIKKELGLKKTSDVQIRKVDALPEITVTRKLKDGSEELTSLLQEEEEQATTLLPQSQVVFSMEREILLVHTDTIIQYEEKGNESA